MRRLYILLIGLFAASSLSAQNVDSLWNKANGLYAEGMFKEAADIYQNIINDGRESADLYYNLANAYYKQNMLGKSILYYERAYKLNSSDEDIAYNLGLARTQVLDKIDPLPTFFAAKAVESIKNLFSPDGWGVFAIVLFAVGLLLILSAYFFTHRLSLRRMYFWTGIVAILLCLTGILIAGNVGNKHEAIIMTPVSTIKSSPDAAGKDAFILYEGTKVRITGKLGEWREVEIADGNTGWIAAAAIETIR